MMGQYILILGETAEQIKRCIPYSQMSLSGENMDSEVHDNMAFIFWSALVALATEHHASTSALNVGSSLFHKNCDKLCDG